MLGEGESGVREGEGHARRGRDRGHARRGRSERILAKNGRKLIRFYRSVLFLKQVA